MDNVLTAQANPAARRTALFAEATRTFGGAIARLVRAYEWHAETRRDLVQEVHIALWNSFASFDGRCSLRTWVFRVAHNVGAKHSLRQSRARAGRHVSLDELDTLEDARGAGQDDREEDIGMVFALIERLHPLDRQLILLYLEDLDAVAIGDITGLSAENVATKIHRIKKLLALRASRGA